RRTASHRTSLPYTTPFRSRPAEASAGCGGVHRSRSPHPKHTPEAYPFDAAGPFTGESGPPCRNTLKGYTVALTQVPAGGTQIERSEEHTSELQSRFDIVCR